jgi:transposase
VCEGSILAALRDDKLIAPLTFAGSCNRQVFEKWLEEILMPTLLPGQTIILDNATSTTQKKSAA